MVQLLPTFSVRNIKSSNAAHVPFGKCMRRQIMLHTLLQYLLMPNPPSGLTDTCWNPNWMIPDNCLSHYHTEDKTRQWQLKLNATCNWWQLSSTWNFMISCSLLLPTSIRGNRHSGRMRRWRMLSGNVFGHTDIFGGHGKRSRTEFGVASGEK